MEGAAYMPASPVGSWTVAGDDGVPVEPVERYLAVIERSRTRSGPVPLI
jgi:hypothetical protein